MIRLKVSVCEEISFDKGFTCLYAEKHLEADDTFECLAAGITSHCFQEEITLNDAVLPSPLILTRMQGNFASPWVFVAQRFLF